MLEKIIIINDQEPTLLQEIPKIIQILTTARKDGKLSRYLVPVLNILLESGLFSAGLYFFFQGLSALAPRSNNVTELQMQKDHLNSNQLKNWQNALGNNGTLCHVSYPSNIELICPPSPLLMIELCTQLVTSYCRNLTELNTSYSNHDETQNILFTVFGILGFILTISAALLYWCNTPKPNTLANSHPFIPEKQSEYIRRITERLSIKMDETIPLAEIITQLESRYDEIKDNRERWFTFLLGSVKREPPTALYTFFAKGAPRELIEKILVNADCLHRYGNKTPSLDNKEDEGNLLIIQ